MQVNQAVSSIVELLNKDGWGTGRQMTTLVLYTLFFCPAVVSRFFCQNTIRWANIETVCSRWISIRPNLNLKGLRERTLMMSEVFWVFLTPQPPLIRFCPISAHTPILWCPILTLRPSDPQAISLLKKTILLKILCKKYGMSDFC